MYRALLKNKRLRGRNVDPDHPWALIADKHARDAARKVMRCVGAMFHLAASLALISIHLFWAHGTDSKRSRRRRLRTSESDVRKKRMRNWVALQLGAARSAAAHSSAKNYAEGSTKRALLFGMSIAGRNVMEAISLILISFEQKLRCATFVIIMEPFELICFAFLRQNCLFWVQNVGFSPLA